MNTIQKLRSLELYLAAHPDCEENSECADRLSDVQELLRELPDRTAQLQADKAELLKASEKISKVTNEGYITDDTDFQVWESELKQVHSEIESLIQKHKQ